MIQYHIQIDNRTNYAFVQDEMYLFKYATIQLQYDEFGEKLPCLCRIQLICTIFCYPFQHFNWNKRNKIGKRMCANTRAEKKTQGKIVNCWSICGIQRQTFHQIRYLSNCMVVIVTVGVISESDNPFIGINAAIRCSPQFPCPSSSSFVSSLTCRLDNITTPHWWKTIQKGLQFFLPLYFAHSMDGLQSIYHIYVYVIALISSPSQFII